MVRPASLMLRKVIPRRMIEAINSGCVEFAEAGFDSIGVATPAAAAGTEQQVKHRLLLDVVVGQGLRPLLPLPCVGPPSGEFVPLLF
jgi:hypothetical protein